MLFFTHWLDLLGKLFTLILFIVLILAMGLDDKCEAIFSNLPGQQFFSFLGIVLVGVLWYLFCRAVTDVLTTKLYVRLHFGIATTWAQAKLLRKLFSPSFFALVAKGWWPMKNVRSFPVEQRLQALLNAANEVAKIIVK